MIKLVSDEIVAAIRAECSSPLPPVSVSQISTDSRSIAPGALFFALRGERFDGHDHIAQALERGALAAVVSHERVEALTRRHASGLGRQRALLAVDDPLAALGRLAHYHRQQVSTAVIAVVGSNGKTTAKMMIDHVLRGKMQGRASPKSFNNAVGVPLTLLSVEAGDEYVVVEIGTNAPGEIAQLARIADPELVVITSIAEEHLEGLHDLAGVAREECSILEHMRAAAFVALNSDAPHALEYAAAMGVKCVTFGRNGQADLRVSDEQQDEAGVAFLLNGRFRYRVPMLGVHNALNAAGAAAVGRRLGLEHDEIAARLESFFPPPMRHERVRVGEITIINDAYNANPQSAVAAIDTLEALPCRGRKHVVFGEMRELGRRAPEMHRRVAERLRQAQFARVILVGPAVDHMAETLRQPGLFSTQVTCVTDLSQCERELLCDLSEGDVVLLKGSRSVGLERLIEPLTSGLRRLSGERTAAAPPTTLVPAL